MFTTAMLATLVIFSMMVMIALESRVDFQRPVKISIHHIGNVA